MKTDELREKYLAFFESKGCSRQPSDVLVPTWDPSVLFTPAGMNQFKDHFLGKVKLDYTRATTCQKCLRTGDIDNVGRTAFHHTFFEMLGNFSFGDYFKRDAIAWAWEFLTESKWLDLDPDRLRVTVYKDDAEAAKIWHEEIGLPTSRISYEEEDENFWPASAPSQGPDGVCGPCSEIYYLLEDGSDVEIWNLVFTQFNRVGGPPDNLQPLPSRNIDTGMGLERTASVLQGVPTNYHIDSLMPIVQAASAVVGVTYDYASDDGRRLRRITDHIRAAAFAVHENVYPGANGAKYVIRRLIRRAVLDGHQMRLRDPFLYQLVPAVADAMSSPYPELSETVERVAECIRAEEQRFFETIDAGLQRIHTMFEVMQNENETLIDGRKAAELYTSYGVPPELLQQMGSESQYAFDWDGYEAAMVEHAGASGGDQFKLFQTGPLETLKESLRSTEFLGYDTIHSPAVVKGIVTEDGRDEDHEGKLVKSISAGDDDDSQPSATLRLVLDRSPFYGESGGQVGDRGLIRSDSFAFKVDDTQKHGDLIVHFGRLVSGAVSDGDDCQAIVDEDYRDAIRRAHSATHVLHHALQTNLGSHAQQQGSKVEPDMLRFDFTHQEAIDEPTLDQIRADVLARVDEDAAIDYRTVSLADARSAGAMMLFGEKYPDPVRMVSMGTFSKELCGGTHLDHVGQIKAFEVVNEESVAAGTRRVVALTGPRAVAHRAETLENVEAAAQKLACAPAAVDAAAVQLMTEVRTLKKNLQAGKANSLPQAFAFDGPPAEEALPDYQSAHAVLKAAARALNIAPSDLPRRCEGLLAERDQLVEQIRQMTAGGRLSADELIASGQSIGDTLVVVAETPGANPSVMRGWIDQIRKKSDGPTAVLLAATQGEKVLLVGGLSRDLVDRGLKAGDWVGEAARIVGGGGGGRPDMAQAGGKDPSKLPDAITQAKQSMADQLTAT